MNTNYCISVDWLQVYCLENPHCPLADMSEVSDGENTFTLKLEDIHTAMFKDVYDVSLNGFSCATIQAHPRSSKLNRRAMTIKLSNRILYCRKYIAILYSIIRATNVEYKGITRVDICYDCIKFADGRSPSRFIRKFLTINDNEIGGIFRKGSDEFTCHGKKALGCDSKVNYISFGSPQSRVRAYIYDKSLELKEVKDKPWIRETWAENGIVPNEKNHVFRSEISIKSEGTDMLNMSTGELFRLSPLFFENQQTIEKLFHYYADRYLYFGINEGQKYRKNRRKLELFKAAPEITCKPIHVSKDADTGRMEKICYNKLEKLSTMYTDLSEPRRLALKSAMEFLKELEGIKSSTLYNERYLQYLDNLKGVEFLGDLYTAYFDSLARISDKEREMSLLAEYRWLSSGVKL